MPEMTPVAMESLSATVRRLRALLEIDLERQLDRRFRLSVPAGKAHLDGKQQILRARLEAWLAERACAHPSEPAQASIVSEMASRALLRLFLLRQLEACGVSRPALLAGGWSSKGYLEFRAHAPELTASEHEGDYEGFDVLLKLLFDELAVDLPGLFAPTPLDALFVVSASALREIAAALNAPDLDTAWLDDTALGWVYQFWNDPQREAIDARVGPRGRIPAHEIASKTQLFTERYMVDWLVQNSVGRIALGMRRARRAGTAVPPWPMYVHAALAPAGELPSRLEELRVLDPACGSGHFLAGAFDLLVPLYREQARELGEAIDDAQIAERILRHNLHGIDIDGRAVQIAAAVLYVKVRRLARRGPIPPMNLIATTFELDGEHNVALRGSLMRFGPTTGDLDSHAHTGDLGVRFDGEEIGAGQRLRSLLTEARYDVVLFNPPYLATAKIDLPEAALTEAFGSSTDLVAAFVERALELCKPHGLIAFVALSNWMFLSSFRATRERLLAGQLVLLADLGKGAFRRASKLIQTAMAIASPQPVTGAAALAARVGSRDAITSTQTELLAQALQGAASYRPFEPASFTRIDGAPLLFWLEPAFLHRYGELPKIAEVAEGAGGIATTNNDRFLRAVWEVPREQALAAASDDGSDVYVPYVKGAEGREWIEPLRWLLRSDNSALELRAASANARVERASRLGVAYTTIGHRFSSRLHSVASVRDVSGASVFGRDGVSNEQLVCALNRSVVRELASAFNPTVNFQLNDVRRLPFDRVEDSERIVAVLRAAFTEHERGNELSLEYREPGPSRWAATQRWAQRAVDRAVGTALPPLELDEVPAAAWQHVSHALGMALGHFCAAASLPDGLLFLGATSSSLQHPACAPLHRAWALHRADAGPEQLASYLRKDFFAEHRRHYESRPIHWPLSSAKRSFVAYVCFHALTPSTLVNLLAEHLAPERRNLEGRLVDLREARQADSARAESERRFADTQKLLEELNEFIARLTELAERGPPPVDGKTMAREVDARYAPELGDGVMVNAAALWPLLEPQWKEPKKLWKELANADGKKGLDWAQLSARYFPARVQKRCGEDASLALAHGKLR